MGHDTANREQFAVTADTVSGDVYGPALRGDRPNSLGYCPANQLYCAAQEFPMERIARQQAIVAGHIRAENEKNWPVVYDTFVQDERAFYEVMPLGAIFNQRI